MALTNIPTIIAKMKEGPSSPSFLKYIPINSSDVNQNLKIAIDKKPVNQPPKYSKKIVKQGITKKKIN